MAAVLGMMALVMLVVMVWLIDVDCCDDGGGWWYWSLMMNDAGYCTW